MDCLIRGSDTCDWLRSSIVFLSRGNQFVIDESVYQQFTHIHTLGVVALLLNSSAPTTFLFHGNEWALLSQQRGIIQWLDSINLWSVWSIKDIFLVTHTTDFSGPYSAMLAMTQQFRPLPRIEYSAKILVESWPFCLFPHLTLANLSSYLAQPSCGKTLCVSTIHPLLAEHSNEIKSGTAALTKCQASSGTNHWIWLWSQLCARRIQQSLIQFVWKLLCMLLANFCPPQTTFFPITTSLSSKSLINRPSIDTVRQSEW